MRLFSSLKRNQSGLALVEFAIVLPILIVMLLAVVEFSRFIILHQKLDKAANAMADYVTQGTTIGRTNLNNFGAAISPIMSPFNFNGTVIFTSAVFFTQAPPPCAGTSVSCIAWQYSPVPGAASRVGVVGGNAVVPGNYGSTPGQNAIIAEIFYNYTPMLGITSTFIGALRPQTIYKIALYKPRLNSLATLGP